MIATDTIRWRDPAEVAYVYRGTGPDRPRFMKHLADGWEWPGVTTMLSKWDRGGLINWSADIERAAVLEAAAEVYRECYKAGPIDPDVFMATVNQHLGPARAHVKKKEKEGDIGKAAHEHIQWQIHGLMGLDRGPEPPLTEGSRIAVLAFNAYWQGANITPLRAEQPVWHSTHEYAGTTDLIGIRDGKLGVVDYKTSKSIYPPMHMQVAAYVKAIEHQYGVPIEWAELWRIPKTLDNLKFEVAKLGDLQVWGGAKHVAKVVTRDQLFRSFLGVLEAWKTTSNVMEAEA